ncbi:MAG: DNA-directed DNA polymerase [Candidatus Nanoarchaeia archaeon]|nr:DNA-directed DNA polymerase [Candidatus Jingweiarchaeum tengchongense]
MAKLVSEFYVLDVDHITGSNNEAIIRIFGVSDDGKKIVALDPNFTHYFYVTLKEGVDAGVFEEKLKKIYVREGERIFSVIKTEKLRKNYLGREVSAIKVYVNHPSAINKISDEIKKIEGYLDKNEFDIPLSKRYLIDNEICPLTKVRITGEEIDKKNYNVDYLVVIEKIENINGEMIKNPKFLAFDIETYSPRGDIKSNKNKIMAISVFSNYGEKKVFISKKLDGYDYIESFESEDKLIRRFIEYIKKESPDFLIGYNSDVFDFPYLRSKAMEHKISLNIGLDNSQLKFVKHGLYSAARIKGIIHIDLYHFIANVISNTLKTETLDLDSVAREILGYGKVKISWSEMWKIWENGGKDLVKICEYCLRDSELVEKLSEKFLPLMFEITKLVAQPLFEVSRMKFSQFVESYLIKEVKKFNELIPNRPDKDEVEKRKRKTYMGAFVYQPSPGLSENIVVFDFRSLYPSIIVSHNVCPSTINCYCCRGDGNVTPEIGEEKRRYWFCKKRKGIIPSILESLIERRSRIRKIMKEVKKGSSEYIILDARQQALKTIANSMYGYLGFARARWYCLECAESITAWGRSYITSVIEEAKEKGFDVIYGDTDSIMIALKDKTKEDAINFLEKINKKLPGMVLLELQGFYERGIFVSKKSEIEHGAKKKYALIDEKGEITIKGFEYVRRDWADIAKETQAKVLEMILKNKDVDGAMDYIRGIIKKIKNNEVPLRKMAIYTQMTKEFGDYASMGPHVVAAKKASDRGYKIGPGVLIEWVVTKGVGKISDRATLLEEAIEKNLTYDPDYYIKHQIIPATKRILEALGYSFEEIEGKQTRLGGFIEREEKNEGR